MTTSDYTKILIFTFVVMFTVSCNCDNPNNKKQNPSNPKNTPTNTNGNENQRDVQNPDIEEQELDPVAQQKRVNQAIQELEKEIAKPNPDPKLKAIYEVIRYLPPIKIFVSLDKTESRINEEKNGRELFDKMIGKVSSATPAAVEWLIDKKLLNPNKANEQGILPLEKALAAWLSWTYDRIDATELATITQTLVDKGAKLTPEQSAKLLEKLIEDHFIKEVPKNHHKAIFDFLKKQGATLTPEKASVLLEKLIESQLAEARSFQALSSMVDFLQAQGGTIPAANALVLLEKFIQKKQQDSRWDSEAKKEEDKKLQVYILDVLQQHSKGAIDPAKATALLQQAIDTTQDQKVYKALLQQGANPNAIQVEEGYPAKKIPLLHYVARKSYQEDYKELFQELVNNPTTNINVVGEHNFTIAMKEAYQVSGSTNLVDELLQRNDLDINTTKGDHIGVKDYTLLDIVVANCMSTPRGGHDWQINHAIADSKRWLNTLKKMRNHAKFQVSTENIKKATEEYNSFSNRFHGYSDQGEADVIAREALNIVKNIP
jgi:hypothetical protein